MGVGPRGTSMRITCSRSASSPYSLEHLVPAARSLSTGDAPAGTPDTDRRATLVAAVSTRYTVGDRGRRSIGEYHLQQE
eukprot:192270-Rhodomonas_salina.1